MIEKNGAFEVTDLEIGLSDEGKLCLTICTGPDYEDEFSESEMSRLAFFRRDPKGSGCKVPLYNGERCQIILETLDAEIAFRKMLATAMVKAGIPLEKMSSEVRGIAATSMEVPASEIGQHMFADLATLATM